MKSVVLNIPERMLFALLKASLHQIETDPECFQNVSAEDWKECYQLAARQGVMALAWDGVMNLPASLQPAKALKLTWGLAVEAYEKKYTRYCRTVQQLSDFYAGHGIVTVQLKGVGFSACYPVPSHREGGDIDIYTFSADAGKMSDKEANELADTLMKEQGIEVDMHSPKHSNFYYKGVPIENHKNFLNVEWYKSAPSMNALLHRVLDPQPTELLGGECRICTPSPEFNTVFIAYHAAQHYGSGLTLHHLCDWAAILVRHGLHLPKEVTDKGFLRMIAAMTELCNRYLGTSMPLPGEADEANSVLAEMLHPAYPSEVPYTNKWKILWFKARRMVYTYRLQSRVLERSLIGRVWEMIVVHIRKPETIFK